jgi:hypothetical protein
MESPPLSRWRVFYYSGLCRVFLCISVVVFPASYALAADTQALVADTRVQRIDKVKAAFVLNIARFVTWPAEAFEKDNDRLLLCFYHSNPFAGGLESISGKTVTGRTLDFIRVKNLADTRFCQILLISQIELDTFSTKLLPGKSRPLLTIADRTRADTDPSITRGIMVSLVRTGSRIGFEIDLGRTRSAGLKMSSELLKHAQIVDGGSR